jgi:hypothetical protein
MPVSERITHLLATVREGEEGSLDRLNVSGTFKTNNQEQ